MLGDRIGEVKGKITSQIVLDVQEGLPKNEISFSASIIRNEETVLSI